MHKNLLQFCTMLVLSVVMMSCQNGTRVADLSKELDPKGWEKDSIGLFEVNIDDVSSSYTALINVRHHTSYPYQNLWLFTSLERPDGSIEKDTLECILTDNSGAWLGSGFGSMHELSVLYLSKVRFTQKGTYRIGVGHGMRDSLLSGVNDIGVEVIRNEK
ncbi:MAG: gliding motility lipoprotein GldH [Paludibacteraceae bacterium]|nr:gliding motility lipoprotein GldH [Paludibacteraceae bacterium]